jgi:hypothetical protein
MILFVVSRAALFRSAATGSSEKLCGHGEVSEAESVKDNLTLGRTLWAEGIDL